MPIAIDFETFLIDENNIYPKPVCISSYDGKDTGLYNKHDIGEYLGKVLNADLVIAHNASFECGVIYRFFPELREPLFDALDEGRIYCTKVAEQLINISREKGLHNFSLAKLVEHYFDKDISAGKGEDAWRMRYSELDDVLLKDWPKEASDYAIEDSIWAHKIYNKQPKVNYKLAVQSEVYLNLMASKGMTVDVDRAKVLKQEILDFLEPHYQFLISKGFCYRVTEGTKPRKEIKKLKEYIESLDIEIIRTAKGGVSITGESMEYYGKQIEDPILQSFVDLAVYEKVLTAYLTHLDHSTIYSQYSSTKNTGRTSCSGSKLFPSMNVQQMPREVPNVSYDVRNCFVPRPGFKILSIDYGGLELCSTAHQLYKLYGRSCMRETINSGESPVDMHSKLAARLQNVSYEYFVENKSKYKDARQMAKPINLGFPGGIGYDTMRKIMWQSGIKTKFQILHKDTKKRNLVTLMWKLGEPDIRIARISKKEYALVQDELVYLKKEFFGLYPELERFLKKTHERFLTGEKKWMKNEYDEWEEEEMYSYKVYGFERDWCTYTALCNGFLMQSPSAMGAKKAVNHIVRKYIDHPDIRPIAFIHDEILFEIREYRMDLAEDAAHIMIDEMQSVLSSVRITVEASMSDQWQKADGFWTKKYWKDPK